MRGRLRASAEDRNGPAPGPFPRRASAAPFQGRDVEPVGAGEPRAHLQAAAREAHHWRQDRHGLGHDALRRDHREGLAHPPEQALDRPVILPRQQRAGDVGDAARPAAPAAPPCRGRRLLGQARRRGSRAAAATWRRGCAARCRCRCRVRRPRRGPPCRRGQSASTRARPARGVSTSALAPARRRRSWIGARRRGSPSVAITRPSFCIRDASARVLPPPPAQRSTTVSPGLAPRAARELRALVLDLVPAVQELGLDMQRRPAPVGADRDAQAVGRVRGRLGVKVPERRQRLVAAAPAGC